MSTTEIQATLSAATSGQILRVTTRAYGQTLSRNVIVEKVTRYRGSLRLRIRCADGIFTGTSVIPVKDAGANPGRGIVAVAVLPVH